MTAADHANTVRGALLHGGDEYDPGCPECQRVGAALGALVAQAEAKEGEWVRKPMWDAMCRRAEAAEAELVKRPTLEESVANVNFWKDKTEAAEADRDRLERHLDVAKAEHDTLCGDYGRLEADNTRLREALEPARVFMEHFVPVEEALINGFDVDAWCELADAALATDRTEPELREGIVTVHDHRGQYLGCMGQDTWRVLVQHPPIHADELERLIESALATDRTEAQP